jgi:hypothetical protein
MKNIGKPCTGKPYARFDEGGQEFLLSTLPVYSVYCVPVIAELLFSYTSE